MNTVDKINYLELPATEIESTKAFFSTLFGWQFVDYGPDYSAFNGAGIDGGFYRSDLISRQNTGSVLVVFYSNQLDEVLARVEKAGGKIIKPTYSFPGGKRFHFTDPSGNEYAVWSDY